MDGIFRSYFDRTYLVAEHNYSPPGSMFSTRQLSFFTYPPCLFQHEGGREVYDTYRWLINNLYQSQIVYYLLSVLFGKKSDSSQKKYEPTLSTLTIMGFGNKMQAAIIQSAIFQWYPYPHTTGRLCIQVGGVAMRSD